MDRGEEEAAAIPCRPLGDRHWPCEQFKGPCHLRTLLLHLRCAPVARSYRAMSIAEGSSRFEVRGSKFEFDSRDSSNLESPHHPCSDFGVDNDRAGRYTPVRNAASKKGGISWQRPLLPHPHPQTDENPEVQSLVAAWYAGTIGRRDFLMRATAALGTLAAATMLLEACGGKGPTATPFATTAPTTAATAATRAAASRPHRPPARALPARQPRRPLRRLLPERQPPPPRKRHPARPPPARAPPQAPGPPDRRPHRPRRHPVQRWRPLARPSRLACPPMQ